MANNDYAHREILDCCRLLEKHCRSVDDSIRRTKAFWNGISADAHRLFCEELGNETAGVIAAMEELRALYPEYGGSAKSSLPDSIF